MARFIEVEPINYGGCKKKMLINVEKIGYVDRKGVMIDDNFVKETKKR